MAANNQPIYSRVPHISYIGPLVLANTTPDLSSGTTYLAFTAGTNGSFVTKLRLRSTPAGSTTATVCRVFINNGLTTATAANNSLFDEITLPATTSSANSATPSYEVPLNFALPGGYTIYLTIGTASANGWYATVIGGDY